MEVKTGYGEYAYNEPLFYPYNVLVNKCSGSCNDINNPYVKVSNLLPKTNEIRYVSWHETCACKYRLDASVCNDRQPWKNVKCRCECNEFIHKGRCDDGFIWNPCVLYVL